MFVTATAAMPTAPVTATAALEQATSAAMSPLFIPLSNGGSASPPLSRHITPPPTSHQPHTFHYSHITPTNSTKQQGYNGSSDYTDDINYENIPYYMMNEIPWVNYNKRYKGIVGLHDEICDYFHWAKGSEAEHIMRCEVVDGVYKVLNQFFPDASIQIFGSFSTGLYLPTSDIDLVVIGKLGTVSENDIIQEFYKQGVARDVLNLKTAQVPILKITDKKTSLKIDVSFNTQYGVKCAEFIMDCISKYPCLAPLTLIIKHILSLRKLNEVYTGGLSSYSIVLMVISFLQTHPRLDLSTIASTATLNLGVLLIEFFELYGKEFNYYSCAVDLLSEGRYVSKEKVAHSIRQLGQTSYDPSYLLIRDPVDPKNDVSKGSHKAFQVKEAFEYACNALTYHTLPCNMNICTSQSILSSIMRVPANQVKFRDWVSHVYSTKTCVDMDDSVYCDGHVNLPKYPTLVNVLFNKSFCSRSPCKPKYKCKAKASSISVLGNHANAAGRITSYVKKLKANTGGNAEAHSEIDKSNDTAAVTMQ